MPVSSSYRRDLPELIRSSDETYLRGLAAISRSSASRRAAEREFDHEKISSTLDTRYSLRYKSRSFTSPSLGLSSHRSDDANRKRHEPESSRLPTSSGSPTAIRISLDPTTKNRTSDGGSVSSVRKSSSPQSCRRRDASTSREGAAKGVAGDSEKVGSLVSSPKWSRIKETFESENSKNGHGGGVESQSKLRRNHSQSTSSLPQISSPARTHERESPPAAFSRLPTYRHSASIHAGSSKSSETESKTSRPSRLPTLASKYDERERPRRSSDANSVSFDDGTSSKGASKYSKDESRPIRTDCDNRESVSSRRTSKDYKEKFSPCRSDSDDIYSRISSAKSNVSKVRKSSAATGLSVNKTGGDINISETKESRSKFEPDSFEEKVKALRQRIASTAREYDSIINKEIEESGTSLTRSRSLRYERSTSKDSSNSNEESFESARETTTRRKSQVLSWQFDENESDKNEAARKSAIDCKNKTTDTLATRPSTSRRSESTESCSSSQSSERSVFGDAAARRSLPKSLELRASTAWKKSNTGSWTKVNLASNNEQSAAAAAAKSRVALLAEQFNSQLGGNNVDKSKPSCEKFSRSISVPSRDTTNKSVTKKFDLSPPKYETTRVFKERCLSLPSSRESSVSSLKNSSPPSESSEDADGNIGGLKGALSAGRKLSLVKQVVQSFEEQLVIASNSNSSESGGSSHENTPTSNSHNKSNYSFNNKCHKKSPEQRETSTDPKTHGRRSSKVEKTPTSESQKSPNVEENFKKPKSSACRSARNGALRNVSLAKKPMAKRPDLPPPRKPLTPKRPLYINAPCSEDSLLAELEQWLVQKYDQNGGISSNGSAPAASVKAVPNQSFLWKELGPKLSGDGSQGTGPGSPKMDGGEQRASGNYYSLPFPHPNSPVNTRQDDHIYMEASFVKAPLDNVSSCDSDEGWVDVSDTELDGLTDSPRNSNNGSRVRVRTKSISSQAGTSISRKSWRESVRELAAGPPSLLDDETWNHKDYQDIMIWESVEGDDSSLSSTSDHFYEALYEEIVDNGRETSNDVKRTSSFGLKSIVESPLDNPDGPSAATLPKYDNISGLKKRNSFTESSVTSPLEEASQLKRNWSLTKKDVNLELEAKFKKNGGADKTLSKAATSPPAVLPSASKRKTLIKFILRQKNNNNAAVTTATNVPPPTIAHAGANKKRTRKKGSMFYVRWSTVNRDTRQKSQSENDIASDSGNGTSSERLDTNSSPTKVKRRPSDIRRPSSPPPLPPIGAVATVVRSHSGTKSLEILRPPLTRVPLDEKTKSLDSVIAPSGGPNENSAVSETAANKDASHLKRNGSNSERSSSSSTGTRVSSSSSSSCVPADSPFSLSPKCRGSVASSHSSNSNAGSYINAEDLASKPTTLGLNLTTDSDSLCSYLLINAELKEPLKSPFEEEPLYQFYHKDAKQRATLWQSMSTMEEDDRAYGEEYSDDFSDTESDDDKLKEEEGDDGDKRECPKSPKSPGLGTLKNLFPPSCSGVPSAMELLRQEGGGAQRTLWCEVPEVRNSGILEKISAQDRKIQEAMFEVITSEASYLKSLNILMEHFTQCPEFSDDFSVNCVLGRRERHVLFSDVAPVRDVSARLLADLERRWQENIVLTNICDILYEHASKFFSVYVKYCANQVYQDRILKELKATRPDFIEVLQRLESNPICQGLDMLSFLMLPMQRITRMPLLVDAIYHRLSPDSRFHGICKLTLAMLNKVVAECNEGARRMERMEEMLVISRQLDFKDCKSIPLISASRWLVKKGELTKVSFDACNTKRTFGRASKLAKNPVYFFLFTDLLVVAKKKSEESYVVLDYCPRNMVQVFTLEESNVPIPDKLPEGLRNLFQLTMLQNNEFKTLEMILSCPLESDRTRWMEAVTPPISENPDEKIYEEWDCPQVQCIYPYYAQQPDELSLEESDVVNVLRKMPDGWYEGERLRDGQRGWFPASFSVEIISSHIRARNLRQRYRLLMLSQAYVEEQRKAFMNQVKSK